MRTNTRELKTLSYDAAHHILGESARYIFADNTMLERLDSKTIGVRLYDTIIVEIHSCGNYTLYTGGYMTATTKQRINALTPANVHQTRGEWYVDNTPFAEGIIVNPAGEVVA